MKNWIFSGLLLMMVSVMFSQQTVTGIVLDNDTRLGLPGVNVVILNSSESATTDIDGKFQIDVQDGDVLELDLPMAVRATWPLMHSTGTESHRASSSPDVVLAMPGPEVTRTTPVLPVLRA